MLKRADQAQRAVRRGGDAYLALAQITGWAENVQSKGTASVHDGDAFANAAIAKLTAGFTVVMDRCPKIEHGRFSGEIGWMGINRRVIDNRKPLLFGKGGSLQRA